jgi:hypothetical protein
MIEALHLEFMQNAFMAAFLASIVCGIIGTFVVVNRIVFISGGIAHAAYGGIGLAFFLGLSPMLGILGFALLVVCRDGGHNLEGEAQGGHHYWRAVGLGDGLRCDSARSDTGIQCRFDELSLR